MFVVGDITGYNDKPFNAADFDTAIAILNQLDSSIEWCPLIGNHDILYYYCDDGDDYTFNYKFVSQYNHLASSSLIENWRKQPGKANFSFEYYTGGQCFHFLCLDWVKRNGCGGCAAKLPFTYNFYWNDLRYYSNSSMFGTFLFAHHPCARQCTDPWVGYMGFWLTSEHDDVVYWIAKYLPYINRYAWFNGHEHRNKVFGIHGSGGRKCVITEACKGVENGIARLVQVYSDNCVEMSYIYGTSAAAKVTSADTTVYGDRNKLGSVQAVGAEK